jgi:hypothetical protein
LQNKPASKDRKEKKVKRNYCTEKMEKKKGKGVRRTL